ncbi:uncharacterized protein LOC125681947 [Ostrea edulis]|uniref:uncharacterized protein LOC125681947 n=1 Tax=Ostrea edulis TaxID=37623 RepID=UPI0024AF85E4|nr:uncharacterized protein LOC125681947 [Ostrea edulis]
MTNYMHVAGKTTFIQNMDDFKVRYRVTRQTAGEDAADVAHCNVSGATPGSPDRQFLLVLKYVTNQHSGNSFYWNVNFNRTWFDFILLGCPPNIAETYYAHTTPESQEIQYCIGKQKLAN